MSATEQAKVTMKYGQAMVRGRIEDSQIYEGLRHTRILTPAEDAYSRPQTLRIRSKRSLGSKGEEITVLVRLGGYARKPFSVTDKETGEVVKVTPVDHTLDAIEE